ncbi:MAG TPA: hypothetical protein VLA97_10310 [Nocardioidaceae bacterium]|nr:hypothetical protein [Nocardioidaceae bacterium]
MYARSTTINADTTRLDEGIAHVNDVVLPTLQDMGCIGLSMLVDRASGRCIVTTSWETREAMRASAERANTIRDRAAQIFAVSGEPMVEEWEIAIMHRDHRSREGACVRATWMQVAPSDVDRALDVYRLASLPAMEQLEGFCSASLLIDRETGRCVSSVTYDSPEALERNRDKAGAVRRSGTTEARAQILDVAEFDLALAHLHVPELV